MKLQRIIFNLQNARYNSHFSPENIFKEETIVRTLTNYKKIKSPWTPSKLPTNKAAILIPICIIDGKTSLLYTLRTAHLRSHKSQVSFPGGKHDAEDESLEFTALRETKEELGIDIKDIKIWGTGVLIGNRANTAILPVIGEITKELHIQQLNISPHEVHEVFCVSLEDLCDQSKHGYTQFNLGYSIPVFLGGKRRIWGITAMITHMFLKSLLPQNIYHHKLKFIQPFKVNLHT